MRLGRNYNNGKHLGKQHRHLIQSTWSSQVRQTIVALTYQQRLAPNLAHLFNNTSTRDKWRQKACRRVEMNSLAAAWRRQSTQYPAWANQSAPQVSADMSRIYMNDSAPFMGFRKGWHLLYTTPPQRLATHIMPRTNPCSFSKHERKYAHALGYTGIQVQNPAEPGPLILSSHRPSAGAPHCASWVEKV